MQGTLKGYFTTSRPKFKTLKDSRRKKREESKNEKKRRTPSIISAGQIKVRINNTSKESPTKRRISVGLLKKRPQKR
jgi:hypothetical protein